MTLLTLPISNTKTAYVGLSDPTYSTCRTGPLADTISTPPGDIVVGQMYGGGYFSIRRAALYIDTSSIAATVEARHLLSVQLKLRLWGYTCDSLPALGGIQVGNALNVVDPLNTSDYPDLYNSSIDYGHLSHEQVTNGGYVRTEAGVNYLYIPLNSVGAAAINRSGWTIIGLRGLPDINGTPLPANNWYQFIIDPASYLLVDLKEHVYVWLGTGANAYKYDMEVATAPKVLGIRTEYGKDAEVDHAQTGICELTTDNEDGDFNPSNTSGIFSPDLVLDAPVIVEETYNNVVYPVFEGRISDIIPRAKHEDFSAYILVVDGMDDMAMPESKIETPIRKDTDAGELFDDILDAIDWPAGKRSIMTGSEKLPVACFHAINPLDAAHILENVEKGFFYVSVDGYARFENRHYRRQPLMLIPVIDVEDTMVDVDYEFSKKSLINSATVAGQRFVLDAADVLIWSIPCGDVQAPMVPGGGSIDVWAIADYIVDAWNALTSSVHFNANSSPNKTGTDLTGNITVTVTSYGQAMKIHLANAGAADAYMVVPDTPPVGAPTNETLLCYGKMWRPTAVEQIKSGSTILSKTRSMRIEAPFKGSQNELRNYAEYLFNRFKVQMANPVAVKLDATKTGSPDFRHHCLARGLSDRVTLKSTKLGFDQDFNINKVVQEYAILESKATHFTTWYVEEAVTGSDWLLGTAGYSELGATTVLGF